MKNKKIYKQKYKNKNNLINNPNKLYKPKQNNII